MAENGFVRRRVFGIPIYCCGALLRLPFIRHAFSTRLGGSSPSGVLNLGHVSRYPPATVEEDRKRFLRALGLPGFPLATLAQIHSDRVHILEKNASHWNPDVPGDGLVAGHAGVALAVQVADCFPLLMVDPRMKTVATCHAGWRGTLARIAQGTVAKMQQSFGCTPSDVIVAIGPGIRACCFEVGAEVVESFEREFPQTVLAQPRRGNPEKSLLDLPEALRAQLSHAGVPEANVHDLGACTHCRTDQFFSHRAEGARAGRMMGLIARLF